MGELLPLSESPPTTTLMGVLWGNVMVDDTQALTMLKIQLRLSKCYQFVNGVDVYVDKTGTPCCPVVAMVSYMTAYSQWPYPFFL